jgi:hypothetical protein
MQKNKYIELIRGKVLNEMPTADRLYQADPRRIELDIASALNTVFYQIFKKNPNNLDRYVKSYPNVAVTLDTNYNEYYSDLPAKVIQYPVKGDGVWDINTMQGRDVKFVPRNISDKSLRVGSEAALIDKTIGYSLSGSRITYDNMDSTNVVNPVRLLLVVDFTEWGMTEDVPIPAGQDQNIVDLILNIHRKEDKRVDRLNNQNELA